jgi:hypothetical protein
MRDDNVIDLEQKRRDRRATAAFHAPMAEAIRERLNFEQALDAFVGAACDRGAPLYYVAKALRQCEEAVQEIAREKRGHRKPGPKSKAS